MSEIDKDLAKLIETAKKVEQAIKATTKPTPPKLPESLTKPTPPPSTATPTSRPRPRTSR